MEELIRAINNLSNRDIWDFVIIFGSLMSTVLLFLTYFLARKINKKIDKPVIEKQLSKVYELIEILQNTTICVGNVTIENNQRTLGNESEIKFFEFTKFPVTKSIKTELIIQKSYYEKLEFPKYSNDPFIPKKIAQLLDKFNFNFDTIFEERNSEFNIIGSSEMFAINEINESEDFYSPSLHINNYEDFVSYIKKINLEIINWIKNPKVDLNLK